MYYITLTHQFQLNVERTGKVTVEGTAYDAVMNVEVLDASGLVQEVPEGSLGSVDFDANWQFYLATRTPEVADGGFAAAVSKMPEITQQTRLLIRVSMTSDGER